MESSYVRTNAYARDRAKCPPNRLNLWQVIHMPQARSIGFTNCDTFSQEHFPFVLENCHELQDLYWSGQVVHMKQLKAFEKAVLPDLRTLSLHLKNYNSVRILEMQRIFGGLTSVQNLQRLSIQSYTTAGPGLFESFLPVTRWAFRSLSPIHSNEVLLKETYKFL